MKREVRQARATIKSCLNSNAQRVFTPRDIFRLLRENTHSFGLPADASPTHLLSVLVAEGILILSGKNTGDLGVEHVKIPDGYSVRVTGIERTLIDICVRPIYAGGVRQVKQVMETAVRRGFSMEVLVRTLRKIEYVYPYQQALGYYLEVAGLKDPDLKPLLAMKTNYRFYLTYQMKRPVLSEKWNLYFPKGF